MQICFKIRTDTHVEFQDPKLIDASNQHSTANMRLPILMVNSHRSRIIFTVWKIVSRIEVENSYFACCILIVDSCERTHRNVHVMYSSLNSIFSGLRLSVMCLTQFNCCLRAKSREIPRKFELISVSVKIIQGHRSWGQSTYATS